MEISCPHCNTKAQPEVIAVADLSCTICASCKAVLSTKRAAALATEPLMEEAPLPVFEAPAQAFARPPAQFDDVLSLPEDRDEAAQRDAAGEYVLEVEDVFVAAPKPEFVAEPEPVEPEPLVVPEPYRAAPVAVSAANSDAEQQASQVFRAEEPEAAEALRPASVPPPVPDGYAVGLRVMRIAPVWLLLSSVGFLSVLLLLSWASQPIPQTVAVAAQPSAQAQKNAASNNSPLKPQVNVLPAERPAQPSQPAQQAPAAQPAPHPAAPAAPQPAARPAAPPQPAQPKPSAGGKFAVQVASFKDASEANERVSALRAAGFEAEAVTVEIPNRGLWHRVICGRARTREEASTLGAQLRAKGAVKDVMIMELGK